MERIYTFLLNNRCNILLILTFLLIAQIVQPSLSFVPVEHDWLFGWLLFLTILAWMIMAGLVGVVTPIDRRLMRFAYSFLVVLPLIVFMFIGALLFDVVPNTYYPLWERVFILIGTVWLVTAALVGAVAPTDCNAKAYSILAVFPLISAAWLGSLVLAFHVPWLHTYVAALMALLSGLAVSGMIGVVLLRLTPADKPRILSFYILLGLKALGASVAVFALPATITVILSATPWIGVYLLFGLPLLGAFAVAVPGAALISTMRNRIRNITVAAIGLCGTIVVVGWYWAWTMDDGLDAFAVEDRAGAERALNEGYCPNRINPSYRVVKDDSGHFNVQRRTWWRIPVTCEVLPRWID